MNVNNLVVKYAEWIRRQAMKYYPYGDVTNADDLASETICKALENQEKFNPSYKFQSWVSAIMRNIYITEYNRRKCVQFDQYDNDEDPPTAIGADQRASVFEILSIVRARARLSVNIESVILYAKGYDYREIAEISGVGIGTVKSRIANGRKALARMLESR